MLTVKEAAQYLSVNPAWVSRKAMTGVLPGFKIGNRWRFQREDIDLWIQRQKIKEAEFPKGLDFFLKKVVEGFPEELVSVILYGSYAKGDQTEESDIDVLCLVKKKQDTLAKDIFDLAYEAMWKEGFEPLLSVLVMDLKELERLKKEQSPLVQEIVNQGKTLWKKLS